MFRLLSLLVLVSLLALTLASCGGDSESEQLAPNNLFGKAELSKYPADSAGRSFVNFWSDLQYQSWADAAAYYAPDFRRFIGTAAVIGAKKVDASTFPLTKPDIERVEEDGRETTIYYSVVLPDGSRELGSTTWRKEGDNWLMIYDSRLDPELNQFARNKVEIEENGTLSTDTTEAPSAAASRAGNEAAHLQAEFLEQVLRAP